MKSFKQHTSTAALFLFLLAGCCPASARNILENFMNDPSKASVPIAEYDAATGTVVPEVAKKDMSCDSQLAAALVEAKELAFNIQKELDEESAKNKAALETIVDLQKDLAKTNSNLMNEKDARMELKATMNDTIQEEKDRSAKELEAITNKAKDDLETLREEKDSLIDALKQDHDNKVNSIRERAHEEFQGLKTTTGEVIASLEAKLKMSTDELQETMRQELKKAKEEKETKVAQLTAEMNAAVEDLTLKMEQSETKASELLQQTKAAAAADITAVRTDYDKRLVDMATLMKEQESSLKEEAEKNAADFEEKLLNKNAIIKNLELKSQQMSETIAANEKSLEEANAEITHWRTLHAERSYCNMTHVAEDLYDASAAVYKQASDKAAEVYDESRRKASVHVSNGIEYSSRVLNEKFDEHWPTVAPYYDDIISGNYQKIEPHLNDHVYPKLRQASDWTNEVAKPKVLEAIDDGRKTITPVIESKIQAASDFYQNYCRSSLTEFLKATEEVEVLKEHPPPSFLLESWETSCQNPRESIAALAQGTGVLLALVYFRSILRLTWSIVKFFLLFFVRLTPLGFFLPRKTATKEIASSPPSPSPPAMAASTESLIKAVIDDEEENEAEPEKAVIDDEKENEAEPEAEAAATLY